MNYDKLGFSTLNVKVEQGIAVLTLDRPKAQNAFNAAMVRDLIKAFHALDIDDNVKVVVITGANNIFCAGADFRDGDFSADGMSKDEEESSPTFNGHRDGGGMVALAIHRCRKVTIGAINSHAIGVGITMTLAMDIRLAYAGAKIGFVFVRRGICPEACSSYFLPRLIGHSRAMELILTGRIIPASHPSLNLLFSEVFEKREDVLPAALALAKEIAANNSVISGAVSKALVWHGTGSAEEQHLLDSKAMFALGNGLDSKEGVKAFLEKRNPKFSGVVSKDLPPNWPWWTTVNTSIPKTKL
ncbi:peroxisomal enoyl-CoA-hydratase [Chytridium lagenaria]|nr:peroxisomal enoyl-CoA-hydratase [Chytridium lagenaria]